MNPIEFDLIPPITNTTTAVTAEIKIMDIVLFTSVTVAVYMRDASGNRVDCKIIKIGQPEYDLWTSDDNSLIQIIKSKLGV
jgi:hypothetical protein